MPSTSYIETLKTSINLASDIDATKLAHSQNEATSYTWALYILTISVLSDWFCSVPACTGITGKHLPLLPS